MLGVFLHPQASRTGQADFKTVPGFAFRAIFEGDIEDLNS